MTNDANGPLGGLAVLEAGSMISGPTVGRFMVDFGAMVIKIKHPTFGDHVHRFGPQKDGIGPWHEYLSRNEQSITLNISTDEGATVLENLMGEADLLTRSFRPDTPERWNVGWEHLSEVNDDLVMLRLSDFGQIGSYSERPGLGTLAEVISDFAYLNSFPDLPSLLPPASLVDNITVLFSTFAVMFTPHHRDVHGGGGQYIDTNLIGPIFDLFGPQPLRYNQLGTIESRPGNRSISSAPWNVYRTDDDRQIVISVNAQPFVERAFDAIGRPDLRNDPRFETSEDQLEYIDELDAIIQDQIDDHSHEEVFGTFEAVGVTLVPVYNVEDILNDEHYAAREVFLTVDDPGLGEAVVQNAFPESPETPGRVGHLGPSFGEHNDVVYHNWLGYDESVLSDLEAEDVI